MNNNPKGNIPTFRCQECHQKKPAFGFTSRVMAECAGFNFRLECVGSYEDIDFSSKVERPDLLWRLPKSEVQTPEKDFLL